MKNHEKHEHLLLEENEAAAEGKSSSSESDEEEIQLTDSEIQKKGYTLQEAYKKIGGMGKQRLTRILN